MSDDSKQTQSTPVPSQETRITELRKGAEGILFETGEPGPDPFVTSATTEPSPAAAEPVSAPTPPSAPETPSPASETTAASGSREGTASE